MAELAASIGAYALMIGSIGALLTDWIMLMRDQARWLAPRYLSAAMGCPGRPPFWMVLVGNITYAICLPIVATQQLAAAEALGADVSGIPSVLFAWITAIFAVLFAVIPQRNWDNTRWKFGDGIHIPLTVVFVVCATQYASRTSRIAQALVDAGYNEFQDEVDLRVFMSFFSLFVTFLIPVTLPAAMYAHGRLDISYGYAEETEDTKPIADEKVFRWSFLPFSLGLVQMVIGIGIGIITLSARAELSTL